MPDRYLAQPASGIHRGLELRTVGRRLDPSMQAQPSGDGIATTAAFTESLVTMGGGRLIRKGVYRFASHEDADRQHQRSLAESMADLAMARRHG